MITTSRYAKNKTKFIAKELAKLGIPYAPRGKKTIESLKAKAKKLGSKYIILIEDNLMLNLINILTGEWTEWKKIDNIEIKDKIDILDYKKIEGIFKYLLDDYYGGEFIIKETPKNTIIYKGNQKIGEIRWKEK